MATKFLAGRVRTGARMLAGLVRQFFLDQTSYLSIPGFPYQYAALDSEYTPPVAIAFWEGVDRTADVVITGTIDTSELGYQTLMFTVPGTPLAEQLTVIVYDPAAIVSGEAGNIDAMVDSTILEPVLYTVN